MTPEQKVCADAADLIEQCGWIQNFYGDYLMGYCIIGALSQASKDRFFLWEKARRLVLSGDSANLVDWNDTPGRTKTEVIAALRKAAGVV